MPEKARTTLTDLPEEVILEHLLPVLAVRELASLSAVNKQFYNLANDESVWHSKTLTTFSLNPHTLAPAAPQSGWSKRLYQGLTAPRTYVWGEANHSRLGLPQPPPNQPRILIHLAFVHTPREITGQFLKSDLPTGPAVDQDRPIGWPKTPTGVSEESTGEAKGSGGIVELQAGGWSFAARDMSGHVWVWGQLNGAAIRFNVPNWEDPCAQIQEPVKLPLPCQAESISLGRKHLLVLDADNIIWELQAYGKAYHHTAPCLTAPTNSGASTSSPRHHIVQLSAGWDHSAALTSSGKIHVWYPFSEAYENARTPDVELSGPMSTGVDDSDKKGVRWGTIGNIVDTLDEIPLRPNWSELWDDKPEENEEAIPGARRTREEIQKEWDLAEETIPSKSRHGQTVVRIASGQGFLLALKGNGEVWIWRVQENFRSGWAFLPYFSGPQISHISAQYQGITSYSPITGGVYHTRLSETIIHRADSFATLLPDPLPTLQDSGVIQVAIGDYHSTALTSKGEMYTWGEGSKGQLGLGSSVIGQNGPFSPTRQMEPQKVSFPQGNLLQDEQIRRDTKEAKNPSSKEGKKTAPFVFAITAAGHHTGALLLGDPTDKTPLPVMKGALQPDGDDDQRDMPMNVPGSYPRLGGPTHHTIRAMPYPGVVPQLGDDQNQTQNENETGGIDLGIGDARGNFPGRGNLSGMTRPMFRVGFAGRGARIGGVVPSLQRNWQRRDEGGEEDAAEGSSVQRQDEGDNEHNEPREEDRL